MHQSEKLNLTARNAGFGSHTFTSSILGCDVEGKRGARGVLVQHITHSQTNEGLQDGVRTAQSQSAGNLGLPFHPVQNTYITQYRV